MSTGANFSKNKETMSSKIRPFLMFSGQAEEAMNFYVSLFRDSEILDVIRYKPGEPGPEGTFKKASFRIGDQSVLCTDSFVKHDLPLLRRFPYLFSATRMTISNGWPLRYWKVGRLSCRLASTGSAAGSRG